MNATIALETRREITSLSLVSIGHGLSHFYSLVLPPLFPLIRADFDVSWASMGAIIAVYGIATGLTQIPIGLIVDRVGARPVLIAGMALHAVAVALIGFASSYWVLLALMAVGGVGQAVFHPADYAILAARISKPRMGRAFGVHGVSGSIGWALAPPVMLALATLWDWRVALIIAGLLGLVLSAAMLWLRDYLSDVTPEVEAAREAHAAKGAGALGEAKKAFDLFMTPAIFLLFWFFALIATGGTGIHAFAVVSIMDLYNATLAQGNMALTGYFIASGIGILAGGFLADRVKRQERLMAVSFLISAACVTTVGIAGFSVQTAMVMLFLGGLFYGLVAPSRDILVRNAAPPGSVGTVFAIVSTGFTVSVIGPPLFGWIIDIGLPAYVYYGSAIFTLLAITTLFGAKSNAPR